MAQDRHAESDWQRQQQRHRLERANTRAIYQAQQRADLRKRVMQARRRGRRNTTHSLFPLLLLASVLLFCGYAAGAIQ